MKIALDARPLSTPISGVGRYIGEVLKNFPKNDYEFHLFTHLGIHSTHKSVLDKPNMNLRKSFGLASWKGGLYFNYFLPKILEKESFDLFWGSQQVFPPFTKNIACVLTCYDLVLYKCPKTMRKLARLQQKFFLDKSIPKASHIISISETTRKDIIDTYKFPKEKTSVAFPSVNFHEIQTLLSTRPSNKIRNLPTNFLLSVSTIEPRKNYSFLFKVYKKYREKMAPNHKKWVIAGKIGWENSKFLNELQEDIKKNQDIILFESPTEAELHQLYHKCSLFLFASIYEGFGIPLLEALAHKKPCLVSNISTFHEIGEDKISYLDINLDSIHKWVDSIIKLEEQKSVEINLSQFDWKKTAEHTYNIFQSVLK